MSAIVKKFLGAALLYFILGLLVQTVTVFDIWLGFNPLTYTTATAAGQILLVGWLTQLALALVYDRWLSSGEQGDRAGLVIFVLFNLGLPLVIIGQPGLVILGDNWMGAIAAFGALLQLVAGAIFLQQMWRFLRKKDDVR
jgi:hypothetical protein